MPSTVKTVSVLDRTKESGSIGEPLYLDVVTALATKGVNVKVVGGRYGLGSKDTPPSSIFAVYDELAKDGKDTNTHSGTDSLARTGSDTDTLSGTDTVTDTLVRGGNIGTTMTQQLLTAEQNFWDQYSFFDMWFSDIAEELTLSIYE